MKRTARRAVAARCPSRRQFRTIIQPPRARAGLLLGASCLALAMSLSAAPDALAANECGAPAGGIVTCNHDGSPASDANPYSKGIDYAVADLTIFVTDGAIINTTTKSGEQAGIDSGGAGNFGDLTILAGTTAGPGITITTDAVGAEGISARTRDGDVFITSNSRIITSGSGAQGINGRANGNVTIDSDGRITTTGTFASAIGALTYGLNHDVSISSSGALTTSGYSADGIEAITTAKFGDVDITSSGAITTTGDSAYGIRVKTLGLESDVIVRSLGAVTTSGENSHGVSIEIADGGIIDLRSTGDIATNGKYSDGLHARSYDTDIVIVNSGDIFTRGRDSDGIDAAAIGAGDIKITSARADIFVRGTDSDGISATGSVGSDIDILVRGNITTRGAEGEGIYAAGGGSVTITTIGNITTTGKYAEAILVTDSGILLDTPVAITINGKITTSGTNADAIHVDTVGDAVVTATGKVFASGAFSDAIEVIAGGDVTVTTDGRVSSDSGFGAIRVDAGGSASLTLDGVVSNGSDAFGSAAVLVEAVGAVVINSTADMSASEASGIVVTSELGDVSISSAGDIVAAGPLASPGQHAGISVESFGDTTLDVSGNVIVTGDGNTGVLLDIKTTDAFVNISGRVVSDGKESDALRILTGTAGLGFSYVTISGDVFGGWSEFFLPDKAAAGLDSYEGTTTISAGGSIGALSDVAIFGGGDITNAGTIDGVVQTLIGFKSNLVNAAGGVWNLRRFMDTDGDGVRDTEAVAASVMSETGTATVQNYGTLVLGSADGATDTILNGAVPPGAGDSIVDIRTAGVEQGHLLGVRQFVNGGLIDLQDGASGDLLLITDQMAYEFKPGNGEFLSAGGTLQLDVYLGSGSLAEPTDMLMIDRAVAKGGPTTIQVSNAGGPGALTTGDGILIVNARVSSSADAFDMAAPVVAGAYQYDLYFQNLAATDSNWYLRSSEFKGAAAYPAIANSALTAWRADLASLQDRVDTLRTNMLAAQSLHMPATVAGIADGGSVPVDPARMAGGWFSQTTESSSVAQLGVAGFTQESAGTQFGYDFAMDNVMSRNDWLVLGAFGGEGWTQADFADADAGADFDTTTLGAYASWFSGDLHVDALMKYSLLDGDFNSDAVRSDGGLELPVFGTSLGAGYHFDLSRSETGGLSLQPSVALDYAHVGGDSFTDESGARITLAETDSLRGRVGARLVRAFAPAEGESGPQGSFYFEAGVAQELLGAARAEVSGVTLEQELPQTTFQFGAGFDIALPEDGVSLNFATSYDLGDGEDNIAATGGVKFTW